MILIFVLFSLDYHSFGFHSRLPSGLYSHHLTYHNATKLPAKYSMHSTTITSHGFMMLDRAARGWRHTDYRFQVCSTMFTESERNRGGKFYIYYFNFSNCFISVRRSQSLQSGINCLRVYRVEPRAEFPCTSSS